ncbi:MAG TPA: Cys-tRNA(Pro) deacylase [Dehalococcoidia bacterium]|nr:Cys-tRNA(Pro) deacylase [Dehalococcoidia bacterium]
MSGRETPATKSAARAGVRYAVHAYEHDPKAASYGAEAADLLGLDPARVFKTLIADADSGLVVAIVPVGRQLDLKALAAAAGAKKAAMADEKAAERATGYVLGGISPLGQRKQLPTYIDESASRLDTIFVSAGRRGLEVELAPADLVELTGGKLVPIARDNDTAPL